MVMIMNSKNLFLGFGMLMVMSVLGLAVFGFSMLISGGTSDGDSSSTSLVRYGSNVCIYKNTWNGNGYDGNQLLECKHNVFYRNGQNMTRDLLGGGGNFVREISLCNATQGNAAVGCGTVTVDEDADTFPAYEAGCGLENASGAYTILNSFKSGNWTISSTFTSTCANRLINVTRLQNASDSPFAANSFTLVTLQSSDQLTVNWTVFVE